MRHHFKPLVLLMLILSFSFFEIKAQVSSKAYSMMLYSMLGNTVPEIQVTRFKEKQPKIFHFLDARERKEFEVSHISDALWVGYQDFELERVKDLKKDAEIIVYCSVGYRSEKVSEKLIAAGYTKVQNLYGGIFEWVNQGLPVVDPSGKETERVHAYSKTWGVWLSKGEKVY